jgi:flagellar biosynthesis protein FlhF
VRVLKFEGATMRDAIAKVKAELGDQAVIIATRQIKRGLLGGTAFEISAAVDDTDSAPQTPAFTAIPRRETQREQEQNVSDMISPLRSEMRSLRAMVRASDSHRGNGDLRTEVAELRKLVEKLGNAQPAPAPAPVATQAQKLPQRRPSMAQMLTKPSTGRVLMLVGPTGAGKTTTLAKLAANAALVDNKRVRLITLDNYRVGGVDQIRTFADLIGVPLAVASGPIELAQLLNDEDADQYDLTLVDTAGKSPRDTSSIDELAAELPNMPKLEIHVVIPAATNHATVEALVNRYRPLAPARLLVTKVDEVDVPADLATLPTRIGLPITWITTGQAVPEDIEEPTPARLIELASTGLSLHSRVA